MATYKEKVGTAVVNYAGDYPGAVEGELWYDSTNKDFKYLYPNVTAAGSWRTGNVMNTGRAKIGGSGTQTSALATGGRNPPSFSNTTANESYDGTSWTEVGDLNSSKTSGGAAGADNTAAVYFGGSPQVAQTETWNGTSWTEVADLNSAVRRCRGSGSSTSALMAGGNSSKTATEEFSLANVTVTLGAS